ncbi:MAG: c-type cytochrome, partial [Planctomycetota bacterium]
APANAGSIVVDSAAGRAYVVNPDQATVAAIDSATQARVWETAVGADPRSVALAADGSLWVANKGADSLSHLSAAGALLTTVALDYGAAPQSVVASVDGSELYVASSGGAAILVVNASTGVVSDTIALGFKPHGLALSGDGVTLLASRLTSPDTQGEVARIDLSTKTLTTVIGLPLDTTSEDTQSSGRGLPNYLQAVAVNPDGSNAWVAGKKDNILRGQFREGQNLSFENTVRTISAVLDLGSNSENLALRVDHNDADLACAVAFSPLGDIAFVAFRGTNTVQVVDGYDGSILTAFDTGLAPLGLALDGNTGRLFVHNYLERAVQVIDVSGVLDLSTLNGSTVATVASAAGEALSTEVLLGKQIFNNAGDTRMSRDGYLSCASCHLGGGQDGRVWDFTERGEGLRNTITLNGRRGTGHGPVHWTANFDEIHDFENDIRGGFAGTGFLSEADFAATSDTLGAPKAGLSADLDALAAYVTSLSAYPRSPHRSTDGSMTAAAVRGEALFKQLDCASCHSGADFTDSASLARHDVGTFASGSGQRLGGVLDGLDTPTLKGAWATAPYFHDGSAATLADVLTRSGPAHGDAASLSAAEQDDLVAYLLELDGSSSNPGVSTAPAVDPDLVLWYQLDEGSGSVITDSSGNGNDGTLIDAAWDAGYEGGGVTFAPGRIDAPPAVLNANGTQVTIALWAKGTNAMADKMLTGEPAGQSSTYVNFVTGLSGDPSKYKIRADGGASVASLGCSQGYQRRHPAPVF